MVTPVQVTDEITAKALSIIEKSLSVTPSLNQAANIGQIISQLNDARINNTDLESLFSYIMTLVETYKNQQTTLPPEIMKSVFAKASIAPQRDGFSIDILRKLFLEIQSFSGKFTQSNSFASPQVDSSTIFSIFGNPINLSHSNEIILDMGTQIKDRYRDWTCENNRKCQGAIIRVLSYRDAQEIFPVNSTTLKVQSNIIDIGLYNPNTGDGIKISNLTDKINFEMKINSIGSNDKHLCLYWDASQMTWVQMSEAFVNRTTSTGICSSSHLSMFVVASKTSESIFSCSFSRGSSNTLTSSVKRSY
ncbi:unnamed protein product [Acanthosepion pharaonis]|uniref:Uncharacterized protein n=1 Tax=Acanthosepion pharaonis TaxID=158019 RepID=A0A812C9W2_ACAPH|nr:unnamed protein product [Sepia pharaonis]